MRKVIQFKIEYESETNDTITLEEAAILERFEALWKDNHNILGADFARDNQLTFGEMSLVIEFATWLRSNAREL